MMFVTVLLKSKSPFRLFAFKPVDAPRDNAITVILDSDFPALAAFLGVPVSED